MPVLVTVLRSYRKQETEAAQNYNADVTLERAKEHQLRVELPPAKGWKGVVLTSLGSSHLSIDQVEIIPASDPTLQSALDGL